jgi:cell division protein FtsI/penicillin-binding protein 2
MPPAPARVTEPSRGRIVDTNGLLLATDDFRYDLYVRPKAIHTSAVSETVPLSLTQILDMSPEDVGAALPADQDMLILTHEATTAQCDGIKNQLRRPDLAWCETKRERAYPQGATAAHVLGFTNYKREGIYGVEASYDSWLRSNGDWPAQDFPSSASPLPENWRMYLPSPGGHDLALYLDAPLQYVVERQLREAVATYQADGGTIIVMDPRTGGILALAIYPAFDPNHYSDADSNLWVNSDVGEVFEPGSVFKLVTYSAALDSGHITPDTPFEDSGSLVVSGRTIKNAQDKRYGHVTATEALAHSINVVSARISLDLGPEVFYGYLRRFGFGKLTEVDLNAESEGFVQQPGRTADWSVFDQATNSFGQGISVTPLQMINAAAAIANHGVLLQPRIVRAMVKDGQAYYMPPRIIGRPIRPETARKLTDMMIYTVSSSSYHDLVPGYTLAGKTGTAEIPTAQGYTLKESITSFIGFLPAEDPQVVIMVKLDKPRTNRWAEQIAVPVFGKVANETVRILEISPK